MPMRRIASLLIPFLTTALAADLPVREVILYKSGVGYFARSGPLAAGESTRLDFKATDMNDVLKSLTITDAKGGKIGSVRYDASETKICWSLVVMQGSTSALRCAPAV